MFLLSKCEFKDAKSYNINLILFVHAYLKEKPKTMLGLLSLSHIYLVF